MFTIADAVIFLVAISVLMAYAYKLNDYQVAILAGIIVVTGVFKASNDIGDETHGLIGYMMANAVLIIATIALASAVNEPQGNLLLNEKSNKYAHIIDPFNPIIGGVVLDDLTPGDAQKTQFQWEYSGNHLKNKGGDCLGSTNGITDIVPCDSPTVYELSKELVDTDGTSRYVNMKDKTMCLTSSTPAGIKTQGIIFTECNAIGFSDVQLWNFVSEPVLA